MYFVITLLTRLFTSVVRAVHMVTNLDSQTNVWACEQVWRERVERKRSERMREEAKERKRDSI